MRDRAKRKKGGGCEVYILEPKITSSTNTDRCLAGAPPPMPTHPNRERSVPGKPGANDVVRSHCRGEISPGGRLNHALPDLERDKGIDRGMRNTYSTLRGLTGYLNAQRQGRTCENRLGKNANVGEINSHSQPNKNYVTYWDKSYAEQEGHQFSSTRNFLTGRRLSGASEQKKKAGRRRCREVLFPDGEVSEVRPGSITQRELRFSAHRSRGFCLSICLLGLLCNEIWCTSA